MRTHVAEPWVEEPLQRFVDDARALFALLLQPSGQVLGQFGFTRAVDVMAACALAAAIHASAGQLGRELDGKPFRELYHAGRARQIFIGEVRTTRQAHVFLTVFDAESSLGLVRIYFEELAARLALVQPPPVEAPMLAATFERDLNRNLAILFGRAAPAASLAGGSPRGPSHPSA
jgi:predicted regulator of Ras-like GTPase activity (Roadblock/LC7/MglB family)